MGKGLPGKSLPWQQFVNPLTLLCDIWIFQCLPAKGRIIIHLCHDIQPLLTILNTIFRMRSGAMGRASNGLTWQGYIECLLGKLWACANS